MNPLTEIIKAKTIEKIISSYTSILSLSEQDIIILRNNLNTMSDQQLWREVMLIENFGKKIKILTDRAIVEIGRLQEEEARSRMILSIDPLFI